MAHWLDIGGTLGGMTTDIYSEGLQLPILKYQDRGVVNQTVVDIIKQNVRLPSRAMGDLRAQVTAVKTGERRFLQLLDRYGRDDVLECIAAIMDHSEAMARARTRTIPDGVYEAESYMDDDGIDIGKKVPIRVRVVVKGDEMTVDLSEVSKQVRGFYNSGITTGHACAQVAYKCITSPTDYPDQRRLLPQPQDHRAAGPGDQRGAAGADALVDDLSHDHRGHHLQGAGAGRFPAASSPATTPICWRRRSTASTSAPPSSSSAVSARSAAAGAPSMTEDGVSGTVCINDGDTHNSPNEQAEFKFPIVVERYALVPDSGGAGRRRGGLGVERVVRARTNMVVNNQSSARIAVPGGSTAASTAPAMPWSFASAANGRPISPTPRCWWRSSSPAMPSKSARAAAAATATRWSGRSMRCATTCGRAMSRWNRRPSFTAWCSTLRRSRSISRRRRDCARRAGRPAAASWGRGRHDGAEPATMMPRNSYSRFKQPTLRCPGIWNFGRRARPSPFPLPRRRGKWSAGRRRVRSGAPWRTITRPARAVATARAPQ